MQRLDEIGRGLVPEFRGEEPPTFACLRCGDHGYTFRHLIVQTSSNTRRFVQPWDSILLDDYEHDTGTVADFCSCDMGIMAAAGYWLDKIRPMAGTGRRIENPAGDDKFRDYLRCHIETAPRVSGAVNDLIEKYERDRKRKVREWQDR